MSYTKTCTYCGKTFEARHHLNTLCDQCRYARCEECGKEFKRVRDHGQWQRFCSRECANNAKRINNHWHVCQQCGKRFWDPKHPMRKYCSHDCAMAARRSPIVTRACPICGTEFETSLRRGSKKTCSKECADKLKGMNAARTRHLENSSVIACTQCGKKFRRPDCRIDDRTPFCSRECYYQWVHEQGIVTRTCQTCGKEYEVIKAQVELRGSNYCSKECLAAGLSKRRRGENNPNWKGGNSTEDRGPNWHRQRRKAKRRDKHTCQICGYRSGGDTILDVHHIVPYRLFDGDWRSANKLSNLITLCRDCHAAVEAGNMECPSPAVLRP